MSISDDLLLPSQVEVITCTTVEGVLYGFAFVLYVRCVRLLCLQLQERDMRKQNLFNLGFISLIMALSLCGVGIDAQNIKVSYIDHADYPDSSFAYSFIIFSALPTGVAGSAIADLLQFILSGIQIWRLWVVFRSSRYSLMIIILPVLSLLVYLSFQVIALVGTLRPKATFLPIATMALYVDIVAEFLVSFTVTIAIIVKIATARRRTMKLMGTNTDIAKPYTSIISMLVESFALEFIWLLAEMLFFLKPSPAVLAASLFFANTRFIITTFSYLLVVYRVASGRGWKEDTAERLSSLQWNRDGVQTSQTDTRTSILISSQTQSA